MSSQNQQFLTIPPPPLSSFYLVKSAIFYPSPYRNDIVYGRTRNWNVKNDFVSSARHFGVIWWPYFRVQNRRDRFHFLPHVLHYFSRCSIFPSEKWYIRTKVRHKSKVKTVFCVVSDWVIFQYFSAEVSLKISRKSSEKLLKKKLCKTLKHSFSCEWSLSI